MKLQEVLVDKVRVGALRIQQYIIEQFDTDAIASSGEPMLSCELTMVLGYPAVRFAVDLSYYKEVMLMHYFDAQTMHDLFNSTDDGYVLREATKDDKGGYGPIGQVYDSIPKLIDATLNIMATEGPPADTMKSFTRLFAQAHDIGEDALHPNTTEKLLRSILQGKHVRVRERFENPPLATRS